MRCLVVVFAVVLMTGCTAMKDGAKISINYGPETKVKTIEDQGFWGPTIKTVYAYECVPEEGITQVNVQDGETYTCHGRYVALQPQTAQQSGIAASVVAPVVVAGEQAAGFAIGMDRFGNKMNTSDTNVTQQGGGAEANSSSLGVGQGGSAAAAASGGAGGNGYGYGGKGGVGGSVNMGKHRR